MCLGGVEASQRRERKRGHIFRCQHCTAVPKRCTFVMVERTSPLPYDENINKENTLHKEGKATHGSRSGNYQGGQHRPGKVLRHQ